MSGIKAEVGCDNYYEICTSENASIFSGVSKLLGAPPDFCPEAVLAQAIATWKKMPGANPLKISAAVKREKDALRKEALLK